MQLMGWLDTTTALRDRTRTPTFARPSDPRFATLADPRRLGLIDMNVDVLDPPEVLGPFRQVRPGQTFGRRISRGHGRCLRDRYTARSSSCGA